MVDKANKQEPGAIPAAPGGLAVRVGPAGVAPDDPMGIHIRLEVTGGHADERYEFSFVADGSGEVTTSLLDRVRKVEKGARIGKLPRQDVARILKSIDVGRLAGAARAAQPIPPGSAVGRLTISDGSEEVSVVFMADRGQAETAGFRLDPALEETVEQIYRLAARQLGVKAVRP